MRLTEKIGNDYFYKFNTECKCINKLGQLEDIEDELGMSLCKFIECLHLIDKNEFKPVYYSKDKEVVFSYVTPARVFIDTLNNEFVELNDKEIHWKFNEYGITWALTEGELL